MLATVGMALAMAPVSRTCVDAPPSLPTCLGAGDLKATIKACEVVDTCLGELLEVADSVGARWLVTADHGNADDMVQRDKKGKPLVSESLAGVGGQLGKSERTK
jgi:hypothetical protein